jgi:hypothetical protein
MQAHGAIRSTAKRLEFTLSLETFDPMLKSEADPIDASFSLPVFPNVVFDTFASDSFEFIWIPWFAYPPFWFYHSHSTSSTLDPTTGPRIHQNYSHH